MSRFFPPATLAEFPTLAKLIREFYVHGPNPNNPNQYCISSRLGQYRVRHTPSIFQSGCLPTCVQCQLFNSTLSRLREKSQPKDRVARVRFSSIEYHCHMIIPKTMHPNDKEVKTAAMESRSEQPGSSQKVENDDDASVAESDAGSEEASAMAEVSALPSAWVQQAKAACRAEKTSASAGSTKDRRAIFTPEPMGKYSFLIHTYSQSQSSLALIVRSAVLIAHSFSNSYQSLRCFF